MSWEKIQATDVRGFCRLQSNLQVLMSDRLHERERHGRTERCLLDREFLPT